MHGKPFIMPMLLTALTMCVQCSSIPTENKEKIKNVAVQANSFTTTGKCHDVPLKNRHNSK